MTLWNMHARRLALQRLSSAVNISNEVVGQFSIKTLRLEGEPQLFLALMDLELSVIHISNDVLVIKIRLQPLCQTYVTPSLITDINLLKILREASPRPPGLSFSTVTDFLGLHR